MVQLWACRWAPSATNYQGAASWNFSHAQCRNGAQRVWDQQLHSNTPKGRLGVRIAHTALPAVCADQVGRASKRMHGTYQSC